MWRKFREWFELTKSEERGILVLLFFIVSLWAVNFYLKYHIQRRPPSEFEVIITNKSSELQEKYNNKNSYSEYHFIGYFNPNEVSFEDLLKSGLREKNAKAIINYRNKGGKFLKAEEVYKIFNIDSGWVTFHLPYMVINQKSTENPKTKYKLFVFDPNTADSASLLRLGFKPWQISNLLRYRSRGGVFHTKEDVKRLYGIDSAFYTLLEPYIDLPAYGDGKQSITSAKATVKIELNTADSTALTALPSIGNVLAGRIVKYRTALGGYVHVNQLLEVYGIDSLKWELLLPLIEINVAHVKKININSAEEDELAAHPYIRKGLAREIVAFRKNFRLFQSVTEVEKLSLAKNRDLGKLYPYLTIGEN
ncbi:competence protein ComEA [Thermaurantimonas aggregans]|uniref:Competence protein ComEA n=1 Tax=Thermaurantimonas aggregans TaxID=2173829 RepID=A0A401XKL1_9FLAO|nr:helix-hairpin-helix domain-containing protein [Thermaurantimonas aggregans]MCX8149363.1 helix-hairpin-helix domain-containing protein [Thermaurantimonas aggregans]GCD77511.1 competence protein ComEA [Thermaurantimonas aggregans]